MPPLQPLARLGTRSRRPIGLQDPAGPVGDKQAATQVAYVQDPTHLNANLNDAIPGQNGYATGNAKTLHLRISNDSASETVTLYCYNYAFAGWSKLLIPVGVKNGGDTTTNDAYVEAKWTANAASFQVQVPIEGIDRVAFLAGGSPDENLIIQAAVTTI